MMEGVNSFYDQLSMAQDVKKGKLVLSPERGLERASTRFLLQSSLSNESKVRRSHYQLNKRIKENEV